jgi:hypothetical protein
LILQLEIAILGRKGEAKQREARRMPVLEPRFPRSLLIENGPVVVYLDNVLHAGRAVS